MHVRTHVYMYMYIHVHCNTQHTCTHMCVLTAIPEELILLSNVHKYLHINIYVHLYAMG